MRKTASALLTAAFFMSLVLFSSHPALAAKRVLNVPEKFQEQTQWCWAGVAQAVLKYYGKNKSQGAMANYAWGRTDCTNDPVPAECNQPNWMYGPKGSLQDILDHWGVLSTPLAKHLGFLKVKKQIRGKTISPAPVSTAKKKGYPVIIRYAWAWGGGHFLTIRGFNTKGKKLYIVDPWFGMGYGIYTYKYVKKEPNHHEWTHTLYNVKKKRKT